MFATEIHGFDLQKKTLKPAKTNANPIGAATIANPVKLKYTILKIIPDFYTDLRPGPAFPDPESGTRIPGPGCENPNLRLNPVKTC